MGTGEHSNGIISYIDFCGKANKFRNYDRFMYRIYRMKMKLYGVCGHVLFVYGNKFK